MPREPYKTRYNISIMTQYDDAAKYHLLQNAATLLPYLQEAPNLKVLRRLDTEQPTLKTRQADSTWEVSVDGEASISHVEVQTHNSPVPMPFRVAGYHGFLIAEHQKPVYSTVIYLHPRAGRRDPGGYRYEWQGETCYLLSYRVLRLSEVEGAAVLALQSPGLMPFTPLMRPPVGMSAVRWLKECIDATSSLSVSVVHRHDLVALLSIFGKLSYDESLILASVREDMVNESLVFQRYAKRYAAQYAEEAMKPAVEAARTQGIEQGIEQGRGQGLAQGRGQGAIEILLGLLEARFQPAAVRHLRPLLERIEDVERLKALAPAAASAESLEMFLEALDP